MGLINKLLSTSTTLERAQKIVNAHNKLAELNRGYERIMKGQKPIYISTQGGYNSHDLHIQVTKEQIEPILLGIIAAKEKEIKELEGAL